MKLALKSPCVCGSGKKYKHCCGVNSVSHAGVSNQLDVANALRTAWANFDVGRLSQARDICQRLLKVMPTQMDALYLSGLTYLKDGDIESAVNILERLVSYRNASAQFIASLGLAYHEQGQLTRAVDAYQKAIALEPRLVDAHYNLSAAKIDASNLKPAILSLEELTLLDPQDFDGIFMLGLLEDYQGNTSLALSLFQKIPPSNNLIHSRIDAWQCLKNAFGKKYPPITGSIQETFKIAMSAANLEGVVLEFGVRHANSTRQLAALAQQDVHGFDSFEGIPEDWHDEVKGSYSTRGHIPTVPSNIHLHAGWFDTTLPEFLKTNTEQARLINIDCDIYSSTKTVLDLLAQRIVKGTVIIFDEYIGNQHWREDEYKAFQEAVKTYGWKYEYLAFSFFTKQVVVRIC